MANLREGRRLGGKSIFMGKGTCLRFRFGLCFIAIIILSNNC